MADDPTDRKPFARAALWLSLLLLLPLLFGMFICSQRGGNVEGNGGVDAPERLSREEVR